MCLFKWSCTLGGAWYLCMGAVLNSMLIGMYKQNIISSMRTYTYFILIFTYLHTYFWAYDSFSVLTYAMGLQANETFCLHDVWKTSSKTSQTCGEISFLAVYVEPIRLQHTNLLFVSSVVEIYPQFFVVCKVPSCVCKNRPGSLSGQIRGIPLPPWKLLWELRVRRTPGSCFGLIVCLRLVSPVTWRVCCRTLSSACFNAASWCRGELRLSANLLSLHHFH